VAARLYEFGWPSMMNQHLFVQADNLAFDGEDLEELLPPQEFKPG